MPLRLGCLASSRRFNPRFGLELEMPTGNDLYTRLERNPAVLMLGQGYLSIGSGEDRFLRRVIERFASETTARWSGAYNALFSDKPPHDGNSTLEWLQHLSDSIVGPEWLSVLADFPWNAVFSSAIDTVWLRVLRKPWRELFPVFEEQYVPLEPRSRQRLHCTFLYGAVNQVDSKHRPPLSSREYLRRRQVAISLARRIPEIVTPMGTLLVEGYLGEQDWLKPVDLAPILDELGEGQVHFFSASNDWADVAEFAALIDEEKLTLHSETLAQFFQEGKDSGRFPIDDIAHEQLGDRFVSINQRPVAVPQNIWSQVTRTAIVVDHEIANLPATDSSLAPNQRYERFRQFLRESSSRPCWEGYPNGYAYSRDFQSQLQGRINRRLQKHDHLSSSPIIVHGGSGSGKTVALGAIAYSIAREGNYPVLFIERRSQRTLYSAVDDFCNWAEDNGAPATVIIWDGMIEPSQYLEFQRYLASRGRKTVLVGSSYRMHIAEDMRNNADVVEAPSTLSASESRGFGEFLARFDVDLPRLVQVDRHQDSSFLVALYRILPDSRAQIRTGLTREVGAAEELLVARTGEGQVTPITALGYALWKANLIDLSAVQVLKPIDPIAVDSSSNPLIGLIMVPGRFGLKVPLELLLRTIGADWLRNFETVLNVDVFSTDEDAHGNISVAPRHPLEARLIAQSRLGTTKQEVDVVCDLLQNVKNDEAFEGPEIAFAVALLRSVGPNSTENARFRAFYARIADVLEGLRNDRSIENPRLMLQEATFLRDYVVGGHHDGSSTVDATALLQRSKQVLLRANEIVLGWSRVNLQLRSTILVELGSVLGAQMNEMIDVSNSSNSSFAIFQEARDLLATARLLNRQDYHPIDVLGWMSEGILKDDALTTNQYAEVVAETLHVFSQANPQDFADDQRILFLRRWMRLGQVFGDLGLEEQAFQALAAAKSGAGYLIRAAKLAGEVRGRDLQVEVHQDRSSLVVEYLQGNRVALSHDSRCLYFLLRHWWIARSGQLLFSEERRALPYTVTDWTYLDEIVNELEATNEGHEDYSLRYLRGLTEFHLGHVSSSLRIFQELDRESEAIRNARRVVRGYMASYLDGSGRPRLFHGTISRLNQRGDRGTLLVEELRESIPFIPYDFQRDLRVGDPIGQGFHIAFNFIGPIADPVNRFVTKTGDGS